MALSQGATSYTIPENLPAYDNEMRLGLKALYESKSLPTGTSIRLIKVLPATSGEPIRCQLHVVDLDDSPKPLYTALSYTWGPPLPLQEEDRVSEEEQTDKRWPIIIDGTLCCVTENLFDCLTQFSGSPESELLAIGELWIDALCINQNDDNERSEQVNMMARIYQSAALVIVWLGKADEETQLARQGIMDLSAYRRLGNDPRFLPSALVRKYFAAVSRLYQRSWFMRVWVIQELLLARKTKLLCGEHEISWEDVACVSGLIATSIWRKSFKRKELVCISAPAKLDAIRRKFNEKKVEDDLLYHLIRSRSFSAEKPMDKVYSLLGLIQAKVKENSTTPLLYANYSLADSEVYVAAAIYILETSSNLFLLCDVEGENFQRIPGLPSWVPDWSVGARTGLGITGYERYQADGNFPRNYKLREGNRILELQGLFLDTATIVGASKRDLDAEIHAVNGELPRWLDIVESLQELYPIKTADEKTQPREEVFWRTLIADTGSSSSDCPAPASLEVSFRSWLLRMLVGTVKTALSNEGGKTLPRQMLTDLSTLDRLATRSESAGLLLPTSREVLSYIEPGPLPGPEGDPSPRVVLTSADAAFDGFEANYSHSPNLRLFRTAQGYLGLGTTSMKDNDTVWIVPGSCVPLIFRKIEEPRRYRLVGGAYLHGFMKGEALRSETKKFEMIEVE